MPFKSDAQRRFMYAKHPRIAARWEAHTPKGKDLPEHVKKAIARIKQANGENEADEPPPIAGKKMPPQALQGFFRNNPSPVDAQVHELAEAYRVNPHEAESQIYGMLSDKMKAAAADLIPGGKADDKPNSDFSPKQLAMGQKVEMEHTNNPTIAKEIATDHLEEFGNYYTALDEMEAKLKKAKEAAYRAGRHMACTQLGIA